MLDDVTFTKHILEAIDSIEQFVDGVSYKKFESSDIISSAVVRKFEIIGEATKNLSDELKNKYKNIPWREAGSMRNILIHEYFIVDLPEVWNTIKNDLPFFKKQIEIVLQDLTGTKAA